MFKQLSPLIRQPWFAYFDLACVLVASALWYLTPANIPWTLPLTLALTPWVLRLLISGRPTARTPFDWPLALFLVTALISVWAAYDRLFAWQKFWWIVGGILLFYALANARALWPRERPAAADQRLWGITGLGVIIAIYFIATNDWTRPSSIAAIEPLGRWLQQFFPELPGHRLNPNVVGGMLAFITPFTTALLLTTHKLTHRPRWWQTIALLALAIILLSLLLTTSRGAWLGLSFALALFCLWQTAGKVGQWLKPTRRRRQRFQRQIIFFGLLILLATAVPLLLLMLWSDGRAALLQWGQAFILSDLNRLALWRGGFILATDYPFTGSGLGSFMMLYSTYSLLIHVGHSFHAHNLYLDVALEQGLPALLLLSWSWLLVAQALLRWLRPPPSADKAASKSNTNNLLYAPALAPASLALVTILIHGLVDDAFYGSRAVLLLFIPLAFAVPRLPRRRSAPTTARTIGLSPNQKKGLIILLFPLLSLLFLNRDSLIGAWYANLGAVAQSQAELSIYSWPEWDIQDNVRQQVNLQSAIAYFEQALAADPWQATAHRRLGLIALANADYTNALDHWQIAYQLTPWDNATRQWLGEAYIVNGHLTEGAELWSTVNNQNGQLNNRVYWYTQINDPQRLTWIQEALTLAHTPP